MLSMTAGLPFGAIRPKGNGHVVFTRLGGVEVPFAQVKPLIQGHHRLLELRERFRDSFAVACTEEEIRLSAGGFTIGVHTWGDVDVMHEILVRELYHFSIDRPCVVLDIGMNVGMATLFFAAMPQVQAVHGYELFKPTWIQAQGNFGLNPVMRTRITSWACGLAKAAGEMQLPYHEELKGVVGLAGPAYSLPDLHVRTETVALLPVSSALDRLQQAHPGLPVVMKMDVEGAEGEILAALAESGRLQELTLLLLEWHGRPMQMRVEALLTEHGFITVSHPFAGGDVGEMTAVRQSVG